MNYSQSLDFLDSLIVMGIKRGLDHTKRLAHRLGNPQNHFRSILIGGTNGKGSTAAFLNEILFNAGLKTGIYTSPHLVSVRERIKVGNEMIGEEEFADSMTRVLKAAEEENDGTPTYFEALTLAAFDFFSRKGIEAAVLEVGLGGRLDCTNIVNPDLSIVTSIGFDHQQWLGDDLLSIATEKAGIFKKGRPALYGTGQKEIVFQMENEARKAGSNYIGPEGIIEEGPNRWILKLNSHSFTLPYPSVPGKHQLFNAAMAVRGALALRDQGWRITDEAISDGIADTNWPGRLELISRSPDLYLDGAHNPDACRALLEYVRELPHPRKVLIFASMKDKSGAEMLDILLPGFQALWLTSLPMKRCESPELLSEGIRHPLLSVEPEPRYAVKTAMDWAGPDGCVITAGSLYLAGYTRQMFRHEEVASWGSGL